MLIVCPSCASEYAIDVDHVGAEGRHVRCAACRTTWFISPDDVVAAVEAEMTAAMMEAVQAGPGSAKAEAQPAASFDDWDATSAETPPALEPEPEPLPGDLDAAPPTDPPEVTEAVDTRRRPRPVMARKSVRRSRFSPAAALGLSVVAGICLAVLGRTTVVRAMPQSAGLYARLGLPVNLRGLDLRDVVAFQTQGEGAQLVVEGDIVGVAAEGAPVPPIAVEVRDGHDQVLYRWNVAAPRQTLEHRETARFRASLSTPPVEGRAIRVSFAPPTGAP